MPAGSPETGEEAGLLLGTPGAEEGPATEGVMKGKVLAEFFSSAEEKETAVAEVEEREKETVERGGWTAADGPSAPSRMTGSWAGRMSRAGWLR